MKKIDSATFRQFMGSFATGVAVVTCADAEFGPVGFTINSLTSVSLDPLLLLFCIDKSAHMHKILRRNKRVAIHLLARGQEGVSRHFADRRHHPSPKNIWAPSRAACPILRGTLGWAVCQARAFYKGGDHTIFLCEVTDLKKAAGDKDPLIYFHGNYRDLGA